MRKTMIAGGLAVLLVSAVMMVGCGGDDAEVVTCSICMEEIPAEEVVMVDGQAMCKACAEMPEGGAVVAEETHDCDGACTMTDVPMSKLTGIDGKYYCAGCAAKLQAEGAVEEIIEDHEDHEGHDHG